MGYDSTNDTNEHRKQVNKLLCDVRLDLRKRGVYHDLSKLGEPEKEIFDIVTPKLKALTYGSEEYRESLKEMGKALEHHYMKNRHHPEHFKNGIDDMSLLDVVEMLADWKAATLRHADGDIIKSLDINRKRFGISNQFYKILLNTINALGWR
ncbi:MAG: hypothetical protein EHM86_07175 [Desulfobulbaceae bacterium]|nr:MAG: hypothetical protein EHM86_07175 [Desulfobulbaceae bacterium]